MHEHGVFIRVNLKMWYDIVDVDRLKTQSYDVLCSVY
jgi:hypothetical protein